jgi:hypothetical protein
MRSTTNLKGASTMKAKVSTNQYSPFNTYYDLPANRKQKLLEAIRDSDRRKKIVQEAEPEILGVLRAWKLGLPIPDNQVQDMRQSLEELSLTVLKELGANGELAAAKEEELKLTRIDLEQKKAILAEITLKRDIVELENKILAVTEKLLRAKLFLHQELQKNGVRETRNWHKITVGKGVAS